LAKRTARFLASNTRHLAESLERYERETGKKISVPIEKVKEILVGDRYELKISPFVSLKAMALAATAAPLLYEMTWTFVAAPKDTPFLTSDNPVIYDSPTRKTTS
jgi:nitrogenase molybdenum-iron protein alpha/beta subunit